MRRIRRHTVNERAVRILLECILVKRNENMYVITIMFPINNKLVFVFLNNIRLTQMVTIVN